MKRLFLLSGLTLTILATSCVSKKKYTEMENKSEDSQSELYQTRTKKQACKHKTDNVQAKVSNYYAKINPLQEENESKLEMTGDGAVVSEQAKKSMRETLKNVDPDKLAQAETLSDSLDLAVAYNMQKSLSDGEGIDVNVDRTVVEITVADNLLFKSSSYRVNPEANKFLKKIAEVAKSEPSMEVMVEGHTDSRTFIEGSYIQDNWDLSTRRAA